MDFADAEHNGEHGIFLGHLFPFILTVQQSISFSLITFMPMHKLKETMQS